MGTETGIKPFIHGSPNGVHASTLKLGIGLAICRQHLLGTGGNQPISTGIRPKEQGIRFGRRKVTLGLVSSGEFTGP